MRFCPFGQRAHLVLNAKKIPHDIVFINLKEKPQWFLNKNPAGTVPTIELETGDIIYESLIVADYLDEVYKQKPLHNKDSVKKAQDRVLIEKFGQTGGKVFMALRENNPESIEAILKDLETYEKELASRGTVFFGGYTPGMLDYMIWPWFERIEALKVLGGDKLAIPKNRIPKLQNWTKLMVQDDAVKVSYISPENHAKFLKSFATGSVDYDVIKKA
ncbi:Pyrimidodiazepine synthase [Blattella germanica]|nr:Pyrimidodiazepine synthase [Blattella germanica]